MAIRMRCSKDAPGAVLIHAEGFEDWYQVSHEGLVLFLGERNGYHDSDFYARVWNPETGVVETVEYATTRFPSGAAGAWIDATPEVRAAADAYYARLEEGRRAYQDRIKAEARKAQEKVESEFARVTALKGSQVRLKAAAGTLFWVGKSGSGKSVRVGVKDPAGQVTWGDSKAVRVA